MSCPQMRPQHTSFTVRSAKLLKSLNHHLSHSYNCTYREVAYALESLGLEKGSAIAIDMPMDVNSVVIYLAIVLAGYVVVSIADSFAPSEISTRLILSKAKAIFTQVLYLLIEDILFSYCIIYMLSFKVIKISLDEYKFLTPSYASSSTLRKDRVVKVGPTLVH